MIDTLRVHLNGTHVGEVSQSRQGALAFEYDDEYRASPNPTPLSLSLPLTAARHRNRAVRNYLEGLLPDNQATRRMRRGSLEGAARAPLSQDHGQTSYEEKPS